MAWLVNAFTAPLVLTAAMLAGVAGYAWLRRSERGALVLATLLASLSLWTLLYVLRTSATDPATQLAILRVRYVVSIVTLVGWVAFAAIFTGRESWLRPRRLGVVAAPPVLAVLVVWTAGSHGLWNFAPETVQFGGKRGTLMVESGLLYWANTLAAYGIVLVGVGMILATALQFLEVYRRQAILMIIGAVAPVVGSIATVTGLVGATYPNLTYPGFAISGVALALAFFRYRLLDIVPVARQQVFEATADGIVVLDENRNVLDYDPVSLRILDLDGDPLSRSWSAVLGDSRIAADLQPSNESGTIETTGEEVTVPIDGDTRAFDVRTTAIQSPLDRPVGYVVLFRDVTERRKREQRLRVLTRMLRHNVRTDMNVILGHTQQIAEADGTIPADSIATIADTARGVLDRSEKARSIEETIERGDASVATLDLVDRLEDVLAGIEGRYPRATIEVDAPPSARVLGTPTIGMAIEEACVNAIEHTPDDAPEVIVAVERRPSDGTVEVAVHDDGPGIPETERQALEHGRESPLQHASGIGLWVIIWIVQQCGGTVTFGEGPDEPTVTMELDAPEDSTGHSPGDEEATAEAAALTALETNGQ